MNMTALIVFVQNLNTLAPKSIPLDSLAIEVPVVERLKGFEGGGWHLS
jgi:hypothetical protein